MASVADAGLRVERVAYPDRREGGGERLDQLVVTVQRHDDAGQRCADLAGEYALRAGERGCRGCDVGVVQDDGRALATQF